MSDTAAQRCAFAARSVTRCRQTAVRGAVRRRYRDLHPEASERDRARGAWRPESDWTPDTAAVAAIVRAAGADGGFPSESPPELLVLTGPVRWICQAVIDHLVETHFRNQQAAWGGGGFM